MKKALAAVIGVALLGALAQGCAYGGTSTISQDRVVITRNDYLLFGLLRKVYVCKATEQGLTNCQEGVTP